MKSRRTRNRALPERPFYREEEIERICEDALRSVSLLPDCPSPIRIDRFIEKKFVAPSYEDLPEGVLGFTTFGLTGVQAVCVSRQLDDGGKVGERRVRTTLAHEGGHGLLHAHLFALRDVEPLFGDVSDPAKPKVLCREEASGTSRGPGYDGRWWEFQANTAMGCLLLPKALVDILTAELLYREGEVRNYEWRVRRKAEREEEEREKKRQAERAERERLKRLEQARIDRLLKGAAAFQQAGAIRKYVETIRATQADDPVCSSEELERWAEWALAEAARIDPVVGGKFLLAMGDE